MQASLTPSVCNSYFFNAQPLQLSSLSFFLLFPSPQISLPLSCSSQPSGVSVAPNMSLDLSISLALCVCLTACQGLFVSLTSPSELFHNHTHECYTLKQSNPQFHKHIYTCLHTRKYLLSQFHTHTLSLSLSHMVLGCWLTQQIESGPAVSTPCPQPRWASGVHPLLCTRSS